MNSCSQYAKVRISERTPPTVGTTNLIRNTHQKKRISLIFWSHTSSRMKCLSFPRRGNVFSVYTPRNGTVWRKTSLSGCAFCECATVSRRTDLTIVAKYLRTSHTKSLENRLFSDLFNGVRISMTTRRAVCCVLQLCLYVSCE